MQVMLLDWLTEGVGSSELFLSSFPRKKNPRKASDY